MLTILFNLILEKIKIRHKKLSGVKYWEKIDKIIIIYGL